MEAFKIVELEDMSAYLDINTTPWDIKEEFNNTDKSRVNNLIYNLHFSIELYEGKNPLEVFMESFLNLLIKTTKISKLVIAFITGVFPFSPFVKEAGIIWYIR